MTVIHILLTINDEYSKYLAVTITSILCNLHDDEQVHFTILDGGITLEHKRKLQLLNRIKPFEIEYLTVNTSRLKNVPNSSQAHIAFETNYRLLISSLKPEMEKCIFLDADLIVEKSLKELWNIDISDCYMAATRDQAPMLRKWSDKFDLPENYDYCNTGVMLINLKKWREDNIEEKLFKNLAKYADSLSYPDQDILNITLAAKVKYLDNFWNAMPVQDYINEQQKLEAFGAPAIIHWAGPEKPWLKPNADYADRFWYFARMTPFYEEMIYANIHKQNNTRKNKTPSLLQQIFSMRNKGEHKIIRVLGIKIKVKRRNYKT